LDPYDVWLTALLAELSRAGIDAASWARAWARLIPSIVLIPAFGLPAFPVALRVIFALMLGASAAPGLLPPADASLPLLATLASELARGVPVALSVAICVWGASMAGALIDELRGGATLARSPFEAGEPASPFAVLLSLTAVLAFLELGGPARLTEALASAPPLGEQGLAAMARALAHGVRFAVVLTGPMLALVPFIELLHALIARATHPIALGVLLTPLKSVTLLAAAALLIDHFATGIVLWMDRALPSS
jgi:type III secretory pathway component EscT